MYTTLYLLPSAVHSIFYSQLLALDTCIRDASHIYHFINSYNLSNDKDTRVEVDTSNEYQSHHSQSKLDDFAAAAVVVALCVMLLLLFSMDYSQPMLIAAMDQAGTPFAR